MMKCPTCGGQRIRIDVLFSGSVACEFHSNNSFELYESASLDTHWDDASQCQCDTCGWLGSVGDAKSDAFATNESDTSKLDLEALEKEVERGTCPAKISDPVVNLIATVRSLRIQMEILQRANKAMSRMDGSNDEDTTLF